MDDSIYTFLNRYKNFLLHEKLSPESRIYNNDEQTTFIINALRHDVQLRPRLFYVESTLQAYQRDVRLNSAITFPHELQHDDVGVIIDENSDDYTVGANARLPTSIFDSNGTLRRAEDQPVLHALRGYQSSYQRQDHNKNGTQTKRDLKPKRDSTTPTISCKACLGLGHCVTKGDICYILAKATIRHSFMAATANKEHIQRNAADFKKERKEKSYNAKRSL